MGRSTGLGEDLRQLRRSEGFDWDFFAAIREGFGLRELGFLGGMGFGEC